uniref:Pept_C1 domain-containing protein n=1 Tax=Panagrellus redivivus TaxID=6233 RepID=A0A7E4V4Y1_PANRE
MIVPYQLQPPIESYKFTHLEGFDRPFLQNIQTVKISMASSHSSRSNLLGDCETAAENFKTRPKSVKYVLFQGCIIFVGSFLLFAGVHCLANHVFSNKDGNQKLAVDVISPLRMMLSDKVVDHAVFVQFESLVNHLNITYTSKDEVFNRYQIFSNNLKRIESAQKRNKNALFGVNRFTLMSDVELRAYLMPESYFSQSVSTLSPGYEIANKTVELLSKRPDSVDWLKKGYVTGVKSQGPCTACWAFAVTATIESMRAIQGYPLENRSEQELIDCDDDNLGCYGGRLDYAFRHIAIYGQTLDELYPYAAQLQNCRLVTAKKVKISGLVRFGLNENYLADWVAARGPVATGLVFTFEMFAYKSGVVNPTDCAHHALGFHALAIVGYGTENGVYYWHLKNSWGTDVGDNGYIKVKRGVNCCGIGQYAVAPIP